MTTINGYTAERMLEIENNTIIDAELSGDDLVFTKQGGATVNVGNVRGFPGISDMAIYDPVGTIKILAIAAVPTGYGVCNASVEYEGADYPVLAADFLTGASCINGVCAPGKFRLPDMRGMTVFGQYPTVTPFNTRLATGGSRDAIIVTHGHTASQPAHGHYISVQAGNADHTHPTADGGAHTHPVDGGDFGDRILISYGSDIGIYTKETAGNNAAYTSIDGAPNHNHGPTSGASGAANHGHGANQSDATPAITVNSATGGASGTDKNLPPYRVINWIMRLG